MSRKAKVPQNDQKIFQNKQIIIVTFKPIGDVMLKNGIPELCRTMFFPTRYGHLDRTQIAHNTGLRETGKSVSSIT